MTVNDLYLSIAKAVLGERPTEEDALALMVLLHTHRLRLGDAALTDRPDVSVFEPITQRHAAEVMAAAWPDRADRERTAREHWYHSFSTQSPFEVIDDISPQWMTRVERVLAQVGNSGLVTGLEPED
jgi:hypothetical protein